MRGRTARRVVALLATIACCIALPSAVRAATDSTQTTPPAKSKGSTKSTGTAKSKPSSKSSTKSSSKATSSKTKGTSGKSTASRSSSKSSKANASSKKPSSTPTKSSPSTEAVRTAFDPASPTATSIPGAPAATASAAPPSGQRGPTRIDFDDRLIQGQRNSAGAVYLYDRKELKQRSMIKKRESFREEIVGVVYDSEL